MPTKQESRPGVTRYDTQPKKVYTDEALNEVSMDSPRAAFSYLPHDLERLRARREELGFTDDKERAQKASQEAELKLAKAKLAADQARVDALEAGIAASHPASESKSKAAAKADEDK